MHGAYNATVYRAECLRGFCAGERTPGEGDAGAGAAAEEVPTRPNTGLVALQATETALMWGAFLALQIAKTRFNRCTGAYGGLFGAEIVLAVGTSAFFAWQARRSKLVPPLFGSACAGRGWVRVCWQRLGPRVLAGAGSVCAVLLSSAGSEWRRRAASHRLRNFTGWGCFGPVGSSAMVSQLHTQHSTGELGTCES